MSRRCQKKNHLFLNWLKANRSRFLIEPRILGISKSAVTGYFGGINHKIRFHVYNGNQIDVVVCYKGKVQGYIAEFLLLGKYGNNGYYTDWLDTNSCYYSSRSELRIKACFEPFLEWANEFLAMAKWLAIYAGENETYTLTRLQSSEALSSNMTLVKLLKVRQAAML